MNEKFFGSQSEWGTRRFIFLQENLPLACIIEVKCSELQKTRYLLSLSNFNLVTLTDTKLYRIST